MPVNRQYPSRTVDYLKQYEPMGNIEHLITHQMPLADINKAFDLMHEGKSIRSVVTF